MAILAVPFAGCRLPSSIRKGCPGRKRREVVRSSAVAAEEGDVASADRAVEALRIPSSLISADNVQKAIRGIAITDTDHYARLGISRGTSYEAVTVAYESKCEELMRQGLKDDVANEKMDQLKESYAILSSEEERRLYDWSLTRSQNPERYAWPFETDITQVPTEPAPPQEPEDIEPTRLVGYFFLAWIVLSVVLSVTLNR